MPKKMKSAKRGMTTAEFNDMLNKLEKRLSEKEGTRRILAAHEQYHRAHDAMLRAGWGKSKASQEQQLPHIATIGNSGFFPCVGNIGIDKSYIAGGPKVPTFAEWKEMISKHSKEVREVTAFKEHWEKIEQAIASGAPLPSSLKIPTVRDWLNYFEKVQASSKKPECACGCGEEAPKKFVIEADASKLPDGYRVVGVRKLKAGDMVLVSIGAVTTITESYLRTCAAAKLGDAYGLVVEKVRWRAEDGKCYFFIGFVNHIDYAPRANICYSADTRAEGDNGLYNNGNYFATKKEAYAFAKKHMEALLPLYPGYQLKEDQNSISMVKGPQ